MATLGGAACVDRDGIGALEPGRAGDVGRLACRDEGGVTIAGALSDPVEARLHCGPVVPRHTIVAGRSLVDYPRRTANGYRRDAASPPRNTPSGWPPRIGFRDPGVSTWRGPPTRGKRRRRSRALDLRMPTGPIVQLPI